MAKNMPVPNTRILSGKKTIGNQSHISDISRLLLTLSIVREHYLKTPACNISHVDADAIITFPSHGMGACPMFPDRLVTASGAKRKPAVGPCGHSPTRHVKSVMGWETDGLVQNGKRRKLPFTPGVHSQR